jgi:Protein of unknown function (DUF3175)
VCRRSASRLVAAVSRRTWLSALLVPVLLLHGVMAGKAARTHKAARRGSWVRRVADTSDAMDLPRGIFKHSPSAIARGLKRSVLKSRRTKGTKFQSAMSMLNLYINRSGRALSRADRSRLEATKEELRKAFGRKPPGRAAKRTTRRRPEATRPGRRAGRSAR